MEHISETHYAVRAAAAGSCLPPITDATVRTLLDGEQRRFERRDNDATPPFGSLEALTAFHSMQVPSFSLARLNDALAHPEWDLDAHTTVMALALMRRYERVSGVGVTSRMMHRLFIAATIVACKTHLDRRPSMAAFGHCCGSSVEELVLLELALVKSLDWRLLVTAADMADVVSAMVAEQQQQQQRHHHNPVVAAVANPQPLRRQNSSFSGRHAACGNHSRAAPHWSVGGSQIAPTAAAHQSLSAPLCSAQWQGPRGLAAAPRGRCSSHYIATPRAVAPAAYLPPTFHIATPRFAASCAAASTASDIGSQYTLYAAQDAMHRSAPSPTFSYPSFPPTAGPAAANVFSTGSPTEYAACFLRSPPSPTSNAQPYHHQGLA